MPGRTPAEAVAVFLEPFRAGIKLLDGHAKITTTGRHGYRKGVRYSWSLSYSYKLSTPRGADLWRMHWHPDGRSPAKGPHLHLPPDLDRHLRPVG